MASLKLHCFNSTFTRISLPECEALLLPIWVSDWLWLTGVRSWQLWMGESLPAGSVPDGFSMFFISISS